MALMGTLPLPLPTISWEGPWRFRAVPQGAAHGGKPLAPPTDAGGQGDGFATGSPGAAGLGRAAGVAGSGKATWQPHPCGQALAAGQCCPSARGPPSGTRHCQQAACCLLDSEIWPQLARIQFNYDKQRLHPLSRD